MTKQEKDFLRRIPSMRMEAKSTLNQISYLLNNTGYKMDKEIDRVLDKIKWLDEIEEELMRKLREETRKKQ